MRRQVFLWTVVFFIVGQLLSGWYFEQFWPRVRFPQLYLHLAHLSDYQTSPTIVCLGSSRFGSLISERITTRCLRSLTGDQQAWVFNPSVPSGDFLASERILKELLQRGGRPRFALIEMCPPAICAGIPGPANTRNGKCCGANYSTMLSMWRAKGALRAWCSFG